MMSEGRAEAVVGFGAEAEIDGLVGRVEVWLAGRMRVEERVGWMGPAGVGLPREAIRAAI